MIPLPVSVTVIRTRRSETASTATPTRPPVRLYFTAFDRRFSITWRRRWRSARTWNVSGHSSRSVTTVISPRSARRAGEVDRVAQHLADRHRLEQELEVARLDPGDVEDLVDQVQQMATGPHDVADGLAVMVGQVVHLEELGEAQHTVERGAQLVAHPRQEVALGLAGLLGGLDRHVHLRLDLELVGDVARHHHRAHGRAVVPHHRLAPGVEHDPATVGVTDAVGEVELGVGLARRSWPPPGGPGRGRRDG